jgi:integrase
MFAMPDSSPSTPQSPRKSRRQGNLQEVAPGKWIMRVSLGEDANGRRVRLNKTIFGTKAEAQRQLNAAIKRKDDGVEVMLTRQSLGIWIEEWLRVWGHGIADRTRADYGRILTRYLPQELRGRQLPNLTAADVQQFVNSLMARGLSPRTVRMAHGALRTCLNRAVMLGKITRNVATLVELPRNEHHERHYLGPTEATTFLAALPNEEWGAFFGVLLLAGLRPGEALGLQWGDLDGTILRVRRALVTDTGRAPYLSCTKTGKSRVIPLGESAMTLLRAHRKRQLERRIALGTTYRDQDLIFPNELGGFADLHNIGARHFKTLLKRLQLPAIRLYDLRHSHATLLLAAGEHPKVVQERLGHSSITLTLDTYTHVVPSMQERATERLDSLLGTNTPRDQSNVSTG